MTAVYERTTFTSHADAQRFPWIFQCPAEGCYHIVSAETLGKAELSMAQHTCSQQRSKGMSILTDIWDELDVVIWTIRDEQTDPAMMDGLKGRASGLAFTLSKFCVPHFRTEEEVLKQAMKRWKMDKGLIEHEATPTYNFNPPPPGTPVRETPRGPAQPVTPLPPRPVPKNNLTEAQVAGVQNAYKSGVFSLDDISKAFGLTLAQVRQVLEI